MKDLVRLFIGVALIVAMNIAMTHRREEIATHVTAARQP